MHKVFPSFAVLFLTVHLIQSLPRYVMPEAVITYIFKGANGIYQPYNSALHNNGRNKRSLSSSFGPDSSYTAQNGLTCFACRPGFYKSADCSVNRTTAVCEPCPNNHYNSMYSIASRCAACSSHCVDVHAVVDSKCNSTADMACRCKDGFFDKSKGGGEWICMPHAKCPPGQEVEIPGNPYNDTKCQPCPEGTYSDTFSEESCVPCSRCTSDQKVKQKCDGFVDTSCEEKASNVVEIVVPIVCVVLVLVTVIAGYVLLRRKGYIGKCINLWPFKQGRQENEPIDRQNTEMFEKDPSEVQLSTDPTTQDVSQKRLPPWSKVFCDIQRFINIDEWKSVIRNLLSHYKSAGEIEHDIDTICHDYKDKVGEQIYQGLMKWLKLSADDAYLDQIISALERENMLSLAAKLQQTYPQLLQENAE